MKPGDHIKLTLAWGSRVGKAVGVFDAIIEKEIDHGELVEVRITGLESVGASNPRESGEITREQIEEEIEVLKSEPMTILRACAMGAPLYIKSPLEKESTIHERSV